MTRKHGCALCSDVMTMYAMRRHKVITFAKSRKIIADVSREVGLVKLPSSTTFLSVLKPFKKRPGHLARCSARFRIRRLMKMQQAAAPSSRRPAPKGWYLRVGYFTTPVYLLVCDQSLKERGFVYLKTYLRTSLKKERSGRVPTRTVSCMYESKKECSGRGSYVVGFLLCVHYVMTSVC